MEDLENKVRELTERVEYLEKKERQRIRKRNIQIALNIIKVLVILTIIGIVYVNVNNKVIKPTKDKIDFVEDKITVVDKKVDNVETYVKEKWDSLKGLNPFKKD